MSSVWLSRLTPTTLTVAAFLLADYGSAALQNVLQDGVRFAFRTIRWVWSIGLGLEALLRIFIGAVTRNPFSFDQAPHVLLSPFVTLFSLFRAELSPQVSTSAVKWWPAWLTHVEWWYGPLLQTFIGLLCLTIAAQSVFGVTTANAEIASSTTEVKTLGDRVLDALLWPLRILWRALSAIAAFIKRVFQALNAWLVQGNGIVLRWLERFDNCVLIAEVRRKMRRSNWCLHWLMVFVVETLIFLSIAVPWLIFDLVSSGRPAPEWGQAVAYTSLVVAWILAGLSVSDGGQAFDRDRSNGTLVFLFLTPLTDRSILVGKILAEFAYALPLLVTTLPWILTGALAAAATGNWQVPVTCGFGILFVLSVLILAIYIQTLFAVRARKPAEGSVKAFIGGAIVQMAALLLMFFTTDKYDVIGMCAALLAATLAQLILAFACWQWTLYSMRRQRYGDVTAAGKTVA
jgi:ABC-type transport system involved in cytochrome c biogenesis permease component